MVKAHQRIIREQRQEEDSDLRVISDIKNCRVAPCSYAEAKAIIMEYEWLGSMAQRTTHTFALYDGTEVIGAVCFAIPPTPQAGQGVAGKENAHLVKTLARGACVWYAPPHAASKLIAGAIDWMVKNTEFRLFVAYSDTRAGEIGTVYQATNWMYTGTTAGDTEYLIEGAWKSGRTARHKSYVRRGIDYKTLPKRKAPGKHRYLFIGGNKRERKALRKVIKYTSKEYPKR